MAMPEGMAAFLERKYSLLQQQADATTMTARANAGASAAAAAVDAARARLMPTESKANVAQTQAATGLIGQQAKFFGPSALSEIGLRNAQASGATAEARRTNITADAEGAMFDPMTFGTMSKIYGPNWSGIPSLTRPRPSGY